MATMTPLPRSPLEPDAIADDIVTIGYSRLPAVFSSAELADAETQVRAALAAAKGRSCFPQRPEVSGTILSNLLQAPWLRTILDASYVRLTGRPSPDQTPTQTLRCLTGTDAEKHAWYFHWDRWMVTAVIPIIVPDDATSGRLLLLPNARPVRRSYTRNVLDKIFAETRAAQRRLRRRAAQCTALALEPGSLYLFSGYRTLHANAMIAPDDTRATLVLHFGDPYKPEVRQRIDEVRHLARKVGSWWRTRKAPARG